MKISANQLARHVDRSLTPCYLISGDETLLVGEALDQIRSAARSTGFQSRDLFVAETGFDWSQLSAASGNLSLFAERRIIELRLPTGKPGTKGSAAIAEMVERAGDDLLFIVVSAKLDRKAQSAKWVKALEGTGTWVQVWPVAPRDMPAWIETTNAWPVDLQPDRHAVRMIAERVEGNLLAAQQEIEKLTLLFAAGPIAAEQIEAAVADSSRFDVYKLIDAALAGDASRTVRILGGLRAEGAEPVFVLWALTRELRMLSRLADDLRAGGALSAAMQRARVWKNRQGLVRTCVGRHDADEFYDLIKLSSRADAAAKGQGPGDAWQLLTSALLRLAGSQAHAA